MSSTPKPAVLLVEDDSDLAAMYGLKLRNGGWKVIHINDAQAALNRLETTKVDAIILDLLLPRHNGLTILHELRGYEDWRKLPVIILSSVPAAEAGINQALLARLGVTAYLEKTKINLSQLVEALNQSYGRV